MSAYWKGKKVLVTGGGGFIGSHLCEELNTAGAVVTSGDLRPGHITDEIKSAGVKFKKIDFFNHEECRKRIKGYDVVMHLAAKVGGINYNLKYMSDIFVDNMLILSNVVKAVAVNKIGSILLASSACVYPRDAKVPTPESEGFRGMPEETNEGYGWAKRALEIGGRTLKKQYGTKVSIVRPYNTYGPRDRFDIGQAHVIAAIIEKIFTSKDGTIEVWGSGKQTRAFLYVKDAVKGMMLAMEKYSCAEPVNLGSDEEIRIMDIAKMIVELSGRDIRIIYNKKASEGYKRRSADISIAKKMLGFKPQFTLKQGLKETIQYYKDKLLKA